MKIAHECPNCMFKAVQEFTDYDYALVHLFETDQEYYNQFVESLEKGREVILDNSIFELGTAFDMEKFSYWVEKLKPTYYIVPDSLENKNKTIQLMRDWISKGYYSKHMSYSKMIGVVQGCTFYEIASCYEEQARYADVLAIPFDFTWYRDMTGFRNKQKACAMGRPLLLNKLRSLGFLDVTKPHHLLGCSSIQEGLLYQNDPNYSYIRSIDTSLPVMKGLVGEEFQGKEFDKPTTKMFTIMNDSVDKDRVELAMRNVLEFRRAFNGTTEKG